MNFEEIYKSLTARIDILIPLIIFILTFSFYIKFLAPSIFEGDSAEFCIACYTLGIPHPNGYPIYTWIGHLFTMIPIGSIAFRVNLMSAFFGAATVSLIYIIIFKLIKLNNRFNSENNSIKSFKKVLTSNINVYRYIAVIAAVSFALSKIFWSQAEIAEVYTLNAFFVAFIILILLKWSENREIKLLYLFFFVYGLSIGAHTSDILFMPVFLLFILWNDYRVFLNYKNFLLFLIFLLIGLSQFIYIFIRAFQYPEYTVITPGVYEWWNLITAKQFNSYFIISISKIPNRILMYWDYLKMDFFIIGIILGIIGIMGLLKRNIKILVLLSLMFVLNITFYLNYYVFDVEVMFIPSFLIFSIFIGMGLFTAFDFIKNLSKNYKIKISFKKFEIDFLKLFILIMLVSSLLIPVNSYFTNYNQIQESNNDNFAYFAYTTLNEIPSNSTIITYWKSYIAFKYFQMIYKINPNVTIMAVEEEYLLNTTNQKIKNGNVFVFHNIGSISSDYYLIPYLGFSDIGTIYKLEKIY